MLDKPFYYFPHQFTQHRHTKIEAQQFSRASICNMGVRAMFTRTDQSLDA